MSSAICFNLDQSKILSSDNGLTALSQKAFRKHFGKGKNAGKLHFFLFPLCFLTLQRRISAFEPQLFLLFMDAFSLKQSKTVFCVRIKCFAESTCTRVILRN